jgi:hypothetical protein
MFGIGAHGHITERLSPFVKAVQVLVKSLLL